MPAPAAAHLRGCSYFCERMTRGPPRSFSMSASEGYVTTTDGVRLFFRTMGMGSKTVLIPRGLYLAGEFAVLGDRCRLVFYDVRNSGKSDAITDPATLAGGIHR